MAQPAENIPVYRLRGKNERTRISLFSHARVMALGMAMSVCQSVHHFVQIYQQLLDGLAQNVALTLVVPRG